MDSFRKSFKSHGSHKQIGGISAEGQEKKPILYGEDGMTGYESEEREVVVKIDGSRDIELGVESNNKMWRKSSYEFWKHSGDVEQQGNVNENFDFPQGPMVDDVPLKLIGEFIDKQKAQGETSLEVDLEMDKLQPQGWHPSPVKENSKQLREPLTSRELKVSFQDPSTHSIDNASNTMRRRYKSYSDEDDDDEKRNETVSNSGEVMKCTSNASFKMRSSMLRTKTRSRLLDPPPEEDLSKSGKLKSGQIMKSGILGGDEDDDDLFFDEDIPEEFKKAKFSAISILEWVSLIVILIVLVCSLFFPSLKRQLLWNLQLWKWEVLIFVLICGHLVSGWVIKIAVFFIERNFLLRKRVLYFVYALRKAVQNCLWLGLVLIAWGILFNDKVQKETKSKTLPYITKVLFCLLVATLLRLIKTFLVKVLASSFHVSTYFDRIQEALFNQFVIETLSGPPLIEIQQIKEEEETVVAEVQKLQNAGAKIPADLRAEMLLCKSGRASRSSGIQGSSYAGKSSRISGTISRGMQDDGITIEHIHKLNQKNISAWNMKRLMNIVRHGVLSTLDEHILDINQEDESATQIRSEHEAKVAAKKIFTNVAKPGSKYIHLVDLMRFMTKDEAIKAMGLFEGAKERQGVKKTALKNWVVEAFRERRALSLTLNDTKTAVNKLHQIVNIVVGVIVVILWLLILGITTTHFLVLISSQLLLVVFIFGNTCKMIFEAIIFLFVMHPFDVGDRCEIEGIQMIVEEMNILTTVFLRFDNLKITYPNSLLATYPISNFYRSPDMGESIDFCVHVSTPLEKIAVIREKITQFIESKKEHWYPAPTIVVRDVDDMNRLTVSIWFQHRMNHQNMGERWVRRAAVTEEMIRVLKELDIEYRMLPLDINVRNMPPLPSSRLPSNWLTCA